VSGVLAYIIDNTLKYTADTLYRPCGKDFTCCEVRELIMKVISTPEEYRVKIIRY
jgi:hypothetical protein